MGGNFKDRGVQCKEDIKRQGPVIRRPISVNPGLNLNQGSFFFCSKTFHQKIFPILFRAFSHQIVDKKDYIEFSF